MSALITDKLLTPCGAITTAAAGGYVDAAGNIVGSPGFLPNYVVDIAGNIGTIVVGPVDNCTFDVTIIGSALEPGPWEVQVGTTETVGTNGGTNTANYTAPFSMFASANTTGYLSGNMLGSGAITIQGGTQAIGGVPYTGGGLIVSHGAGNSATSTATVQTGANFQVGLNETNTTAKIGNLITQDESTTTLFGANTANFFITQALTNAGTTNFVGSGICGQGVLLSTTVSNAPTGVINLDKVVWRNQSTFSGSGTVNVKDGATFRLSSNAIPAAVQINLNGCGWCGSDGNQQGALDFTLAAFTLSAKVAVKSPSCIRASAGSIVGGTLTGGQPLRVSPQSIGSLPSDNISFTNAANTYHGTMTVDNTTLILSASTLQYADIVLERAGRISATGIIGSLASADQTTYWVQNSGNSYINANGETTFAGRFIGDGVNARNYWLEGGEENILHLTHTSVATGHTGTLYARNGSKVFLENGTKFTGNTGQVRISLGSTLGANTTTSTVTFLYMDTGAILDVQAINATTASKITSTNSMESSGGYKVNVPAGLNPGTYPILQANVGGTIVPQLPTVNQNLSGKTPSFAWTATNPRILNMTIPA